MLCLTRKTNERLILKHPLLPSDIKFVVLGVRGDKVTIGVEAPPEVTIHREELLDAKPDVGFIPCF